MQLDRIDKLVSKAKELEEQVKELHTLAKRLSETSIEGKIHLNLGETRPSTFPKQLEDTPEDHPLRQLWKMAAPKSEPVLHLFKINEVDGLIIVSHLLKSKQAELQEVAKQLNL